MGVQKTRPVTKPISSHKNGSINPQQVSSDLEGSKISYPPFIFILKENFLSKIPKKDRCKRLGESDITIFTTRWRSDGQGGAVVEEGGMQFEKNGVVLKVASHTASPLFKELLTM